MCRKELERAVIITLVIATLYVIHIDHKCLAKERLSWKAHVATLEQDLEAEKNEAITYRKLFSMAKSSLFDCVDKYYDQLSHYPDWCI